MASEAPEKLVHRRDFAFMLYELLNVEALTTRERFSEHARETFDAALDSALAIAADRFAPHNRKADENEPTFDGQKVTMIPEVADALKSFCESGFMAAGHDYDLGGMQLPATMAQACFACFNAANISTAAYPFLTIANSNMIRAFGSAAQQAKYLEPLLRGRFLGTMALTEPQAGSSLSDIRTTGEPMPDGSYRLTGNKIFISAGDHDLAENIVHLVLARIKGAPAGAKGLSLFIVPKRRVQDDGAVGEPNDVTLTGLIHKMGYRGTTSTMLSFGEKGDCRAELMGEPHQGLKYMFHMMNEARIGVGLGATMLGYTGYLHSLAYARERPQGRPLGAKDPTTPQARIVEHADVRRMLLAQKAYVEGALALCLTCARLVDDQNTATDERTRKEAGTLLDILTPMAKAWPSRYGFEANSLAIQILGGYGYTREYPVEQFFRDNRLNPIHEGTNGIQALDLLARKAGMDDGAALQLLAREIHKVVREAAGSESSELRRHGKDLNEALDRLMETTRNLLCAAGRGEIEIAFANASVYLDMAGHTVVAWLWLRQALIALAGLATATPDDGDFYQGKLQACAYFFRWELPQTRAQAELLNSLDRTCLEMQDGWF
jgi:butyryl-CoA dehydrogenase